MYIYISIYIYIFTTKGLTDVIVGSVSNFILAIALLSYVVYIYSINSSCGKHMSVAALHSLRSSQPLFF